MKLLALGFLMMVAATAYGYDKFDVKVCEAHTSDAARAKCFREIGLPEACQSLGMPEELNCYRSIIESKGMSAAISQDQEQTSRPTPQPQPKLKREAKVDAKAAEKAKCRNDAECWAKENYFEATVQCQFMLEKMAKIDHEWTDGWLERRFDIFSWKDKDKGILTYAGDHIKYMNGLGLWIPHRYACVFDTLNEKLVDIQVEPGRF